LSRTESPRVVPPGIIRPIEPELVTAFNEVDGSTVDVRLREPVLACHADPEHAQFLAESSFSGVIPRSLSRRR
jgi:hypothetical protein